MARITSTDRQQAALRSITSDMRELRAVDAFMKGDITDTVTAESKAPDGKKRVPMALGKDRVKKMVLDYARTVSTAVTRKAHENSIELEPDERRLCTRYRGDKQKEADAQEEVISEAEEAVPEPGNGSLS